MVEDDVGAAAVVARVEVDAVTLKVAEGLHLAEVAPLLRHGGDAGPDAAVLLVAAYACCPAGSGFKEQRLVSRSCSGDQAVHVRCRVVVQVDASLRKKGRRGGKLIRRAKRQLKQETATNYNPFL